MARILLFLFVLGTLSAPSADLSVTDHASIQAALDAHPNRMLYVPPGDYLIQEKIRIRGERSGLFGPGRIIQQKADQPIIEIEDPTAASLRVR